jgi:hypothetical protein
MAPMSKYPPLCMRCCSAVRAPILTSDALRRQCTAPTSSPWPSVATSCW